MRMSLQNYRESIINMAAITVHDIRTGNYFELRDGLTQIFDSDMKILAQIDDDDPIQKRLEILLKQNPISLQALSKSEQVDKAKGY